MALFVEGTMTKTVKILPNHCGEKMAFFFGGQNDKSGKNLTKMIAGRTWLYLFEIKMTNTDNILLKSFQKRPSRDPSS